ADVTCLVGDLAPTTSATFVVGVRLASSLTAGTQLVDTAVASSTETEPTTPASFTTTVERSADLAITKTASSSEVTAGTTFSYTFTVTNDGPSDASSVVVTDTPSSAVTVQAPPGCNGSLSCTIGSLTAGASTSITVVASLAPDAGDGQAYANVAA